MVHIAVDIGASSGRLLVGEIIAGKLKVEEIHRFTNGFTEIEQTLYWDTDHLLTEIIKGLAKAKSLGVKTCTVGIDTWAVDYVLVGADGQRLREAISYRDHRTDKTIDKVIETLSKQEIYQKTGVQFLPFNTLYQLCEEDPRLIAATKQILLIPDYLGFRLTGKAVTEVTNASTMQLLNVERKAFDEELLDIAAVQKEQFPELTEPGKLLGMLQKASFPAYDLPDCQVITVASHDTASAVAGTPGIGKRWAYLSSGTWSLLGVERDQPVISDLSLANNYTNEWGAFQTYRFLKNIMGMWIIQEVRRNLPIDYDYPQFVEEAQTVKRFQWFVDFNDDRFLHPDHSQ